MDGDVFHKQFQTSVFKLLNLFMEMFLIFRQKCYGTPIAIVPSAALNSIQIGYIATVSLFAQYANEVGFSPYITSIFTW